VVFSATARPTLAGGGGDPPLALLGVQEAIRVSVPSRSTSEVFDTEVMLKFWS